MHNPISQIIQLDLYCLKEFVSTAYPLNRDPQNSLDCVSFSLKHSINTNQACIAYITYIVYIVYIDHCWQNSVSFNLVGLTFKYDMRRDFRKHLFSMFLLLQESLHLNFFPSLSRVVNKLVFFAKLPPLVQYCIVRILYRYTIPPVLPGAQIPC